MKVVALTVVISLCLGHTFQTLAQRPVSNNPLGYNNLEWIEIVMRSQALQREREIAQRQVEARMALKRKGDTLDNLYKKIDELLTVLGREQSKQFQMEIQGVRDIKQDVIVSKLTEELRKEVGELWKINRKEGR